MKNSKSDLRIKKYPKNLEYQIKSYEKIPVELFLDSKDGSKYIAQRIAKAIREKQDQGEDIVLGLATGSSPLMVYAELINEHREKGLSFHNVYTFNLDEYYPLDPERIESYDYFMHHYFFNHIDIPEENIHIPKGSLKLGQVKKYCDSYEKKIKGLGGIDIQLLGIGRSGHIGFNEPGSEDNSLTRLVRLDHITRHDAADDFGGLAKVPYEAITMGVQTILDAKEIYIMAWGQHKADIVKEAIEGKPSALIPSTFLQKHEKVKFYLDTAAANKLTRVETPWKVGSCNWDDDLACKAVVWLSQLTNKPILKLTDEDYNEYGLSELILNETNAYRLNIKIFNRLQHTITGWPGGKPNTDDSERPERATPKKKRVLLFSPHPDDDVISMGGTFLRLVEQGHEVHVAYQTSGNTAVHDHDALRYLEFYEDFHKTVIGKSFKSKTFNEIQKILSDESLHTRTQGLKDTKGLIRRGEARAAARFCGVPDDRIHFMDMPFYEADSAKKRLLTEQDIKMTVDLINKIKPHQVFAAGDLADPHGTHRICLNAVIEALTRLKSKKWVNQCWLWLYRGAWQEFNINEIEMCVPLSPNELVKKRNAIFLHQSQKDRPLFPGEDEREFWQRAEDRCRKTANDYRNLGFAEYEAMEAFRRWHF